jgi:uncharacterized protein (DUF433 family)/DNA-binding transcriptional MerR regulator
VYTARRAAALAGVPVSTLHYWARTGIYVPSISPAPRVRLWSWADLLALRAIDFFHRAKDPGEPKKVSIRRIREALSEIERRGLSREELSRLVALSRGGELFIRVGDEAVRADASAQSAMPDMLALVRPYGWGPDLLEPRPRLRIIPGKLHGEPHLLDTRIPSATIYALRTSGYTVEQILDFYPEARVDAVEEAIDLEDSLATRAA